MQIRSRCHTQYDARHAGSTYTTWLQVIALLMQLYILSRIEATASNTDKVTVKTKNMKGCVCTFASWALGLQQNCQLGCCDCKYIFWILREEKVEEMSVKKYDAKQSAEALQRVVLVRVGGNCPLQRCAALHTGCGCLLPADTALEIGLHQPRLRSFHNF